MAKKFRVLGVIITEESFKSGLTKILYIGADLKSYTAKEKNSKIAEFVLNEAEDERFIPIDDKRCNEIGYVTTGSPVYYAYVMYDNSSVARIAIAKTKALLGVEIIRLVKKYHFDIKSHERFQDEIYEFFYDDITSDMILQFNKENAEWKDVKKIEYGQLNNYFRKSIIPLYGQDIKFFAFENANSIQFLAVLHENMMLDIHSANIDASGKAYARITRFYRCAGLNDSWRDFLQSYYKVSDFDY